MKKAIAKNLAPLYVVLGNIKKGTELNIRVIPLTKAKQKENVWSYPSTSGNAYIPNANLNCVDTSDFTNSDVIRKFYRGYCLHAGINSLVDLIKSTHANKNVSMPVQAQMKMRKMALVVSETPAKVVVKESRPASKTFSKIDQKDIDAVNDFLAGKKEQFSVIYKRYYPIILQKYSSSLKFNKELAEDLTEDLFMKVLQNLHSYQPHYTFNSWISRVAKNFLIDYTRKPGLNVVSLDANSNKESQDDFRENPVMQVKDMGRLNPEEEIVANEKTHLLIGSIESLDDVCRTAIQKRYYEDKSYEEIAEEMNMSLGSVKSIIFRSKAKLKTIIEADKVALAVMLD